MSIFMAFQRYQNKVIPRRLLPADACCQNQWARESADAGLRIDSGNPSHRFLAKEQWIRRWSIVSSSRLQRGHNGEMLVSHHARRSRVRSLFTRPSRQKNAFLVELPYARPPSNSMDTPVLCNDSINIGIELCSCSDLRAHSASIGYPSDRVGSP